MKFKKGDVVVYGDVSPVYGEVIRYVNQHCVLVRDRVNGWEYHAPTKQCSHIKSFNIGDKVITETQSKSIAAGYPASEPGTVIKVDADKCIVDWGNWTSVYHIRDLVLAAHKNNATEKTVEKKPDQSKEKRHPHADLMAEYERRREHNLYNTWEMRGDGANWKTTDMPTFIKDAQYRLKKQDLAALKKEWESDKLKGIVSKWEYSANDGRTWLSVNEPSFRDSLLYRKIPVQSVKKVSSTEKKHVHAAHIREWSERKIDGRHNVWEVQVFAGQWDIDHNPQWIEGYQYRLRKQKEFFVSYDEAKDCFGKSINAHLADLKIVMNSGTIQSVEILNKGKNND